MVPMCKVVVDALAKVFELAMAPESAMVFQSAKVLELAMVF